MRLWHQSLITKLPRQQLLGQHRECCALRGAGWGRPYATVNYVFTHSPEDLVSYHIRVMEEMRRRGYNPDGMWRIPNWRGTKIGFDNWIKDFHMNFNNPIYPEHDDAYLQECLNNLKGKGIIIDVE